jgi:hypothetical protein
VRITTLSNDGVMKFYCQISALLLSLSTAQDFSCIEPPATCTRLSVKSHWLATRPIFRQQTVRSMPSRGQARAQQDAIRKPAGASSVPGVPACTLNARHASKTCLLCAQACTAAETVIPESFNLKARAGCPCAARYCCCSSCLFCCSCCHRRPAVTGHQLPFSRLPQAKELAVH